MTACSLDALDAGEPLPGTAPLASAWVVVEQPGPWGRNAITDSHLDPVVAAHLASAKGSGTSVLLARHPDRPERAANTTRHVWVGRSVAGGHLLRHGHVDNLSDVLAWDWAAIASGQLPAVGSVEVEPVTFICTHAGRDRCCAVSGRAIVTDVLSAATGDARERIWECSHVGGHRFAPVMLTLPSGAVHGRLDAEQAREVIARSRRDEVFLERLRGQSGFPPPFQVAAIDVLAAIGSDRDDELDVLAVRDGRAVPLRPGQPVEAAASSLAAEVRHHDGRAWRVELIERPLARQRLESCGSEPADGTSWLCSAISDAPAWR